MQMELWRVSDHLLTIIMPPDSVEVLLIALITKKASFYNGPQSTSIAGQIKAKERLLTTLRQKNQK